MHPILTYILWDVSPEIINFGFVTLRWYGLLFASGFIIGQYVFANIFKIEGKPEKDLEKLMIYMVVATVVGARLGHCFFYQPEYFLAHPIEILYVWEGGLASHGAGIGIILALYLYSRNRAGQSFWWVMDRMVIVVALGGALIRTGNLMNSEIIGKPTNISSAFVFSYKLDESLARTNQGFAYSQKSFSTNKKDTVVNGTTLTPLKVKLYFEKRKTEATEVELFLKNNLALIINNQGAEVNEHYRVFGNSLPIQINQESKYIIATCELYAIPRHPAQLYEAISCLLLFAFLLWLYYQRKGQTPEGQLFAIFMIVCFGLRFVYEFLKESQVPFEDTMTLNMGQILSIPAVLIGFIALFLAKTRKEK